MHEASPRRGAANGTLRASRISLSGREEQTRAIKRRLVVARETSGRFGSPSRPAYGFQMLAIPGFRFRGFAGEPLLR